MAKGFGSRGMGGMGGGMNMNMIKQAQKMQQDMMRMQQELEEKTYEASAGGGVVTATVSGKRELKALKIDPDAVDPDDVEMLEDLIVAAVNEAMRAAEGAKMKADVESRLCFLEERVGRVETLSAGRVEAYTARLYEKLKTILEDRSIDDARVLTEAAIFGDKTAVDEETVRLRSHIAQYRSILELDEPVGRKLDFLTQELNRETNTIGSKCQDLDITRTVVDMKAEIEKIREQIQNLE